MGKRTVEKASCEKGLFADAQSLKQSLLRCGTRFVGAAEGAWSGRMRRLAALCIAAVLVFSLSGLGGCAGEQSSSAASSDAAAAVGSESSAFEDVAAAFDVSALDLDYSKRDLDTSYDEASATHIALSGSSASVDGSGATVDGSTVTISSEGTYIISGELSSGQIVVDASDDAKVQLVLAGATIHNENGPAIYAKNVDKCFVTLADGTQNSFSDGTDYTLEDDSDEPYATLFCRCDLTINGTGALNVTANYCHGICSKDDLVVTGGTLNVTAVEDCLRGRDCVKIADGSFSLVSGGDGIKSNKDTEATQGFVSITGATFSINAGDDAVQAKTYIGITDGAFSVTSADDAFHSDLQMAIAGGEFTVSAGDDAFHAETELAVDGGTIDVISCCEGLEAEKVYVNGGDTSIVASDDAVNSSAAALSDSSDDDEDANDSGAPGEPGITVNGETPGKGGPAAGGSPVDGGSFPGGSKGGGNRGGAPGAGSSDCLIQVNGGTLVLDSAGDAIDSNGSVEITGGTVLMIGSSRMAQSFSGGTQPFLCTANVSGSAGDTVAIVDANGNVIASITAAKQFGMVLASSPKFTEGGEYTLVIDGMLTNADAHGYTDFGTVSGGGSTSATASTMPSSSVGSMGSGPGTVGVER